MRLCIRVSVILLALLNAHAYAESHALIMTIGEYTGGVPRLEGSKYDVGSARAIANKMGVKDQNIRYYKDEQLTVAGMRKAFDELDARIADNDQVFIYFSGHGGRWPVPAPENRCAVSLVAVDGEGFTDSDMQAALNRLAIKAQKIVMFADACHSGGLKTRALSPRLPEGFTPRFFAKEGPDACEAPVNLITNTLRSQSRSIGKGVNNFVYIAAARENEVSWDMGKGGGAATQAWRDCITGAATDMDGSGGLTAEEIRQCAQEKIERTLKGFESQGVLPSHVTLAGNANAVLAFATRTSTEPTKPAASAPPATVPSVSIVIAPSVPPVTVPSPPIAVAPPVATVPSVPTKPAPSVPPATVPSFPATSPPSVLVATAPVAVTAPAVLAAPAAPSVPETVRPSMPAAYYTLLDVFHNRDDRRVVTLTPAKSSFRINQDDVKFSLTSSHAGYIYLLMVGSDGKTFDMIFPNKLDTRNEIEAGQTLQLPRPAWQITAGGPVGKDHLLAIVADAPRDFAALGMQQAGPFSMVAATLAIARDIQLVTATPPQAAAAECQEAASKRTLVVQKRCSTAYGAAMLAIEEVN